MKRLRAGILAAAVVSAVVAGANAFAGEPRIEALELRYDFGPVSEGAQLEHLFRIRNAGEGELVIERVVPT